jgi:hypothetical protein
MTGTAAGHVLIGAVAYWICVPAVIALECVALVRCEIGENLTFAEVIAPIVAISTALLAVGAFVAWICVIVHRWLLTFRINYLARLTLRLMLGASIGAAPMLVWQMVTVAGHSEPNVTYYFSVGELVPWAIAGLMCALTIGVQRIASKPA